MQRARQKGILEEEAIKVESACINRKLENTQLAKKLLQELRSIKEEAYEILKNNKEDLSNYIDANQYEANFENDYSNQELVAYFNSCGEALHPSFFRRALFEEICIQGQETFELIMKRLGQPEPVSTQDFMDLLQLVPHLDETILMSNADLKKDEVILDQQVKHITQVVLRIIIQSTPLPLARTIQLTSLQEIKKRIHKLTVAIEQKLQSDYYNEARKLPGENDCSFKKSGHDTAATSDQPSISNNDKHLKIAEKINRVRNIKKAGKGFVKFFIVGHSNEDLKEFLKNLVINHKKIIQLKEKYWIILSEEDYNKLQLKVKEIISRH